jgi:hypothetical protein
MKKIFIGIFLLIFIGAILIVFMVGIKSSHASFNLNPQGFSTLIENIKMEYTFITSMSMDYTDISGDFFVYVGFNEEKTLTEVEDIKGQIIQYLSSDNFYQAIFRDRRIQRTINSKDDLALFNYYIIMTATHNGGYAFRCERNTSAPIDINDLDQWKVSVRDLPYRIGWPTAKPAD